MKVIKSILFLVIEDKIDEKLLKKAINVAKNNSATIKFLRIYDSYSSISMIANNTIDEVIEKLKNNFKKLIDGVCSEFKETKYTYDIRDGIWFVEAIRDAVQMHADIIVISEPKKRDKIFESNAMHIIRKSPIPVWVIRREKNTSKKLLVAVDIDLNDKIKANVNAKCMEVAKNLINSFDHPVELVIFHSWVLNNEWYLRNVASNISASQIDERVKRERLYHEEWFNSFCAKYNDMHISRSCFIHGDVEDVMPAFVREENVDTVVMGSVSNINIKGVYIGSRAEAIILSLNCSLVTLKPDNFSSPVI